MGFGSSSTPCTSMGSEVVTADGATVTNPDGCLGRLACEVLVDGERWVLAEHPPKILLPITVRRALL